MEIYDHDSLESITYKNNSIELENWLAHFSYIDQEICSLLKMGKKNQKEATDFNAVLSSLESKREENLLTIDEFNKYKNALPKAAECEDVSCDMFYVNEHDRFRKAYRSHLEGYRNIKEKLFKLLSK